MKHWMILAILAFGAAAQDELKLPEGDGKKLVQDVCTKCHDLEGVVRLRYSKERWEKVVDEMVGRGAEGTDEELEKIVDYLGKNFGPEAKLRINLASAKDIASALGVPQATADAVVSERTKNGPFKAWDDLKRVSALDLKSVESKKDRVVF